MPRARPDPAHDPSPDEELAVDVVLVEPPDATRRLQRAFERLLAATGRRSGALDRKGT